jgi:hypothetical protein
VVVEDLLGAAWRDFLELDQAAQSLRDFHIEEMRRVQPLVRRQRSRFDSFSPVCS